MERKRLVDMPGQLKYKTDDELKEIMRDSIDNQYVPSSIYHKAKQELEFRNTAKPEKRNDEIVKLSPEFYGVGINLNHYGEKLSRGCRYDRNILKIGAKPQAYQNKEKNVARRYIESFASPQSVYQRH